MTSLELKTALLELLDEESGGFYSDSLIYSALTAGQRDLINKSLAQLIALRSAGLSREIESLKPLIDYLSGTIPAGSNSFTLPGDYMMYRAVRYVPSDSASDPVPAIERPPSVFNDVLKFNSLTQSTILQPFFKVTATKIVFEYSVPPGQLGAYELDYYKIPSPVTEAINPILNAYTHEAIKQFAYAYLLRADRRIEESIKAHNKYLEMLKEVLI